MYQSHATFIEPENEDIKIWRYMDFTKFFSLLDSQKLFFTRTDKFDDPFEGSFPKINFKERKDNPLSKLNKLWPKCIAVNCWHENEHESAAMWKLYLKSEEGIAIQSTYKKLKNSITDSEIVHLGRINYIDYELNSIDTNNVFGPFVYKRKSFEHEREIRALVMKWPIDEALAFSKNKKINGLSIEVNLNCLIETIYVAPNSQSWFKELVIAAIRKYGYNFDVKQSKINSKPLF